MFSNIITPPNESQVELYINGICSRADYKKFPTLEVKSIEDINLYERSWNDHKKMYLITLGDLPICVTSMCLEDNMIVIGNNGKLVHFPNRLGGHDLFIVPAESKVGEEEIKNYITGVFQKKGGQYE